MVKTFSTVQRKALQSVSWTRILLETDSPHLKVDRAAQVNTPDFLADIGSLVASLKETPIFEVMQATQNNVWVLYGR